MIGERKTFWNNNKTLRNMLLNQHKTNLMTVSTNNTPNFQNIQIIHTKLTFLIDSTSGGIVVSTTLPDSM
jgi:glucose-6-phosphate 1-dehydrogenase